MQTMSEKDVLGWRLRSIIDQKMKNSRVLLFGLLSLLLHPAAARFNYVFRQALSGFFCGFLYRFFVRGAVHANVKYNSLICFIVEFSFAGCTRFPAHLKHLLSFDFIRYYINIRFGCPFRSILVRVCKLHRIVEFSLCSIPSCIVAQVGVYYSQ